MTIDWPMIGIIVSAFLAWNGFLVWVIKFLLDRSLGAGERRFDRIDKDLVKLSGRMDHAEERHAELLATLPLQYVQREDWIRMATTIDHKMDGLAFKIDGVKDQLNARG